MRQQSQEKLRAMSDAYQHDRQHFQQSVTMLRNRVAKKNEVIEGYQSADGSKNAKLEKLNGTVNEQGHKLGEAKKELEKQVAKNLVQEDEIAALRAQLKEKEDALEKANKRNEQEEAENETLAKEFESEINKTNSAIAFVVSMRNSVKTGKKITEIGTEEYETIRTYYEGLDKDESIWHKRDLQVAMASLTPYKDDIRVFVAMFNPIIQMTLSDLSFIEDVPANIYHHFDFAQTCGPNNALKANERHARIKYFVETLAGFLQTRFMSEAFGENRVIIDAVNKLNEGLKASDPKYLNFSKQLDAAEKILGSKKYKDKIVKYYKEEGSVFTQVLSELCDDLVNLVDKQGFDMVVIDYAIRAFAVTHEISDRRFEKLREANSSYLLRQKIKASAEEVYQSHFPPGKKSKKYDNYACEKYLRDLFEKLNCEYPDCNYVEFLTAHFHVCLEKLPSNGAQMKHPLFSSISPIVSMDGNIKILRKQSDHHSEFINLCVQHFKANPIFPQAWRVDLSDQTIYIALINILDACSKHFAIYDMLDTHGFMQLRMSLLACRRAHTDKTLRLSSSSSIPQLAYAELLVAAYYAEDPSDEIPTLDSRQSVDVDNILKGVDEFTLFMMGGIMRRVSDDTAFDAEHYAKEVLKLFTDLCLDKTFTFLQQFSQWSQLFKQQETLAALKMPCGERMLKIMEDVLRQKQAQDAPTHGNKP